MLAFVTAFFRVKLPAPARYKEQNQSKLGLLSYTDFVLVKTQLDADAA